MAAAVAVAALLLGGACSGDDDDEPTFGELVEEIEGEDLTQGEVARRREVAQFLCGLDRELLVEVWDQLSPRQLEFQDVVFRVECPDRLSEYAAATGRFRTDGEGDAEGDADTGDGDTDGAS